jgi:hypothetical protein
MVNSRDNEHVCNRVVVDWQVERRDSMLTSLTRRPLVILYDGGWLVEAERADQVSGKQVRYWLTPPPRIALRSAL